VAARLAEACGHPSPAFWPQQISLLQEGLIRWERILSPRQISDAYLLALAVAHGGRLNLARRLEHSADGMYQLDHNLPGDSAACPAMSPSQRVSLSNASASLGFHCGRLRHSSMAVHQQIAGQRQRTGIPTAQPVPDRFVAALQD